MSGDKTEQDDSNLFRKEMADIKKLNYDKVNPIRRTSPGEGVDKQRRRLKLAEENSGTYIPSAMIGSEETLSFRRAGVQERVLSKLRNGHFVIDAELDLHGMTIPVAQQALSAFLSECQQYRIRHARIIHGKGWGSKDHKPVIKTWLNGWLRELDDVLAFCSARVEDGGTGAVYLLLRKPKEPTST